MLFLVFVFLSIAAVIGVLGLGLYGLATGGEFNRKYANKLMQARVALQAVAIAVIMLTLYFVQKG
ncbi:MAG: twin transmembrane helix small protein [Alphaproteobacteria bacterium]|nr:twin transmembrane helix small protein [Alphaproteobacteria bacterium]